MSHVGLPWRSRRSGLPVAGEWGGILRVLATLAVALLAALAADAAAEVRASYQYHLSNFWGAIPYQWASLTLDRERNEVYALDPRDSDIRVFNEAGMEVYDFGDEHDIAHPVAVAVGAGGDLFVLSTLGSSWEIDRCNYRGERIARVELDGLPARFSAFRPSRLEFQNGLLYLADVTALQIVVIEPAGRFVQGHDVHDLLLSLVVSSGHIDEKAQKELGGHEVEMGGFSVDRAGNIYFTVPVWFAACRLNRSGQLEQFGRPGSAAGKFGVVSGITADDRGFIYVTDRLRCAVLVFSSDFEFQTEFGFRGGQAGNLVVPDDIEIDGEGHLYVSQAANRGVSVFKIVAN